VAGCRSHNDCPNDQACVNGQCHNPCSTPKFPCGTDAQCRVSEHRAVCLCPDGYQGEPSQICKQYECLRDDDCESNKYCSEDKVCRNPCLEAGACGNKAQCRVIHRHAQCSCPPGYYGNPLFECKQGKLYSTQNLLRYLYLVAKYLFWICYKSKKLLDLTKMSMLCSRLFVLNIVRITVTDTHIGWTWRQSWL